MRVITNPNLQSGAISAGRTEDLDIAPIKFYPPCNSHIFGLPVNFQHNRNLPDMGTTQLKAMSDLLD
jgi:hypothetical protein